MTNKEAKSLFKKYRSGKCSPEELALLESWYAHYASERGEVAPDESNMEKDLQEVWKSLANHRRFSWRPYTGRVAATIALLVIGSFTALIGFDLLVDQHTEIEDSGVHSPIAMIEEEESSEAYIMVGNRKRISLDNGVSGDIYEDGKTIINKTGGKISYEPIPRRGYARLIEQKPLMNTIVIPRGRQYELVLSDGTQVWLNSLSSIKFPARFGRRYREVEITGEAYFDVAHDSDRPFIVTVGGQRVKVLGTQFNINAYEDEQVIRTTLLEGKIEVGAEIGEALNRRDGGIRVLQPGQQSRFSADEGKLNVVAVDTEAAVAWKSGLILFEGASIKSILRQVSRWYDLDVKYVGPPPSRRFTGGVSRNAPLSEFLRVLELNEISFANEGNSLRIFNNRSRD